MTMLDTARELAILDGSDAVQSLHLLLAMAGPGGALEAASGGAAARAAVVLLPGVTAIREARSLRAEAVERGDARAVATHRAEEQRIHDELVPVIRSWHEPS
jgi:hypothetical protein